MRDIIGTLLLIYPVVLACRAVFSWFPVRPGTLFASINSVLFELTEPVLRPVRKVIPPAGMIDLSFMVVFIGILVLRSIVLAG